MFMQIDPSGNSSLLQLCALMLESFVGVIKCHWQSKSFARWFFRCFIAMIFAIAMKLM